MRQEVQSSVEYVRNKSRSFYWPLRLLPRDQAEAIADLYRFCRIADDWADDGDPMQARDYLLSAMAELKSESPVHFEVAQALRLVRDWGVPKEAMLYFLEALAEDTKLRQIEDSAHLMRFCYGVAGVIGLMLCPLLRVRSASAKAHAIDLGIAMQLSNISRDVLEDAERGRIYIPATWLPSVQRPEQLLEADARIGRELQSAVTRLLDLAESYYLSALNGYCKIPFRSRVPIRIAAGFYREVGRCVHPAAHAGFPASINPRRRELARWLLHSLFVPVPREVAHEQALHAEISTLPGVGD